jgi:hypothetical protein
MEAVINKRFKVVITLLLIISSTSFSQLDIINGDFFRGGVNDGVKLFQAFSTPWANAFGAGLSGGWYNTAKPHKLGGFDITLTTNIGFVPSSAETFDLKTLKFQNLTLPTTGSTITPTIAGPATRGPELQLISGTTTLAKFKTPAGINFGMMPVPMIQAGIGLPLGTEVKVRYFPTINISDYKLGLWGVGLVHSIMQYIPGNDLLPFDVSVFGGYSILTGVVPIDVQPENSTNVDQKFVTYASASSWDNQRITTSVSAWNLSLIGSVKLAVLTFYGGLGYSKTNTNITFKGNYPIVRAPNPLASPPETKPVYDDSGVKKIPPVDISNFSGLRANIGMRLKLAIITIHADYTRSNYNVVSTGLGFSFR